jgi:hypothetical protein
MDRVIVVIVSVIVFVIVCVIVWVCILEHRRKNHTLQHFKNVDTKKASFSLTTIPSRIKHIEPNIQSLVAQNPKTVYLHVPHFFRKTNKTYEIPKWLDDYVIDGSVTLVRTHDRGPATKFLGLLDINMDPEHYVVIVDDDQIYNEKLLSNLLHKVDSLGGECVVGADTMNGVTGYSGYIFKRRLLNGLSRFVWPDECYFVDDIWITNYFLSNGVRIVQLFDVFINNMSIGETPKNLAEFLNVMRVDNTNLEKGTYREKVQQIHPLYGRRGDKNERCQRSMNDYNV